MKINKERLHQKLEKEFYFKSMVNISEKVLSSIDYKEVKDDKELYNKILRSIKSKLIYSCECWEVMRYYQTPDKANLESALNDLLNDLFELTVESKE